MTSSKHTFRRYTIIPIMVLVGIIQLLSQPIDQQKSPELAIASLCNDSNCPEIKKDTFFWVWPDKVPQSSPWQWHPAVFLGKTGNQLDNELYSGEFKVAANGMPRELRRLTNISKTIHGNEDFIYATGDGRVAFSTKVNGQYNCINIIDYKGEPKQLTQDWSKGWQLANQVGNFQRTGRIAGLHWQNYILKKPSTKLTASRGIGDTIVIQTPHGKVKIEKDGTVSSRNAILRKMAKGRPAALAFAVDTIRDISFIGPKKIERLKNVWFQINDWLKIIKYELSTDESTTDIAYNPIANPSEIEQNYILQDWPPKNISPILKKPHKKEGEWFPIQNEIFTPDTSGPPLFYQTFLRPDKKRRFSKIHITAWDPARVALKMVAGVREPISVTGIRGTGEIPRSAFNGTDHLSNLVGAFNGAFQSLHGEWGMTLNRKTLLPPRSYGATIAELEDDKIGIGTWPHPPVVPPKEMISIRQNLQPLVENGKINPYGRRYWGGIPPYMKQQEAEKTPKNPNEFQEIVTTRTGLCINDTGKIMYFYGGHVSSIKLGMTMIQAGCDYGIHLDMNSGHCGFEYYRVDKNGHQPKTNMALDPQIHAEGIIPRRKDLFFRARKLISTMGHMRFPRYIGRDPRDFFYLIKKESIYDNPPANISPQNWKPTFAVPGYKIPAMSGKFKSGRLFKFDLSQTEFSVENEKPKDAMYSFPFVLEKNGIVSGAVQNDHTLMQLQPSLPIITFKDGNISFGPEMISENDACAMDEKSTQKSPPKQTLVQAIWPSMADIVPVTHAIGITNDNYIYIAETHSPGKLASDILHKTKIENTVVFIHPDMTEHLVLWFTIRHKKTKDWQRLFPEVEPVPPSVWIPIKIRRGRLLDHEKETERLQKWLGTEPK